MSYVVVTSWRTAQGDEERAIRVLSRVAVSALELPGTSAYSVSQDPDERTRFLVYQEYADKAAFEAHHSSPHIEDPELGTVLDDLVERRREVFERIH